MKISRPWRRLQKGTYCLVDIEHNDFIAKRINGEIVLDVGCGYGSLVHYLSKKGKWCIGIDIDARSIEVASRLFPNQKYILGTLKSGIFKDNFFDHIVLRDVLHHIFEEGDLNAIFKDIKKILKPKGTLIIFDPNVNFILRTCRKLMLHKDAECTVNEAKNLLCSAGFKIYSTEYTELFALALSGGYVGINFIPPIPILQKIVVSLNSRLSKIIARTRLAPHLLWRYCIVAGLS